MANPLLSLGRDPRGIVSVCTAHPVAIAAALEEAQAHGQYALIEATCNQVNHDGGYTGMKPAEFIALVKGISQEIGFPEEKLIFGGDHLGPNPWRHLPADEAMAEAKTMMAAYVEAGFRKLHLDCSMGCRDEPVALDDATTAARAAELCAVAEEIANDGIYIIGTEIPPPGGAHEEIDALKPTAPAAVLETYGIHARVFTDAGLAEAFERVIAIVVQPGVESAQMSVVLYDPSAARDLVATLPGMPGLVFEAHSTDYQTGTALKALVEDGFGILKVGPCLTFAVREALYGMEMACREMDGGPLALRQTMEDLMQADPGALREHVHGDETQRASQRHFGLSDRIRYYWPNAKAQAAVADLYARCQKVRPPIGVVSQYVGAGLVNEALGAGDDLFDAEALARRAARRMVRPWYDACK
ncbi:class II D-tagatose-bisphosphate aldolase non-catalytic subunit [Tropicimonas marinistellae]|uniref:class II D-tagatose-bisphosphate aldolase non-catalytic subunit n=1 Tax=Tropicimonas marinistellae TaxID=1739787 RepID=UPI0008359F96|nr:class II D-tagatose-bisphosphate aldolase, non-catalytic subunit [Tropicimonas marinistellae]